MKITFVKKILADGAPCAKCRDVEQRLEESGLIERIDEIVVADERDATSPGMLLASRHGVTRAPFFVVERDGDTQIYTVYFKFAKEVLGATGDSSAEAAEILRDNPELDLL